MEGFTQGGGALGADCLNAVAFAIAAIDIVI
jgi:hypothetical protein